jgi:hypothetical protein
MEFPSLALGTAQLWPVNAFALRTFGKAQRDRTRPKSPKACQKTLTRAKFIAEVKQTQVERRALRNFTTPLAVGKA